MIFLKKVFDYMCAERIEEAVQRVSIAAQKNVAKSHFDIEVQSIIQELCITPFDGMMKIIDEIFFAEVRKRRGYVITCMLSCKVGRGVRQRERRTGLPVAVKFKSQRI